MKNLTATLLATSLLSLTISSASAHGLWTEQRRGNIEVIYGEGAADDAYKPETVSRAWAYDMGGEMIPVTVERLTDHARLVPLSPPALMAVALDNGMWSQTADKKWTNLGRSKVPGTVTAIQTYKYSLALYEPGAKLPALDGLKMVIVPLADPLSVGVGKALPVKVLVDGKPAADIKLYGDFRANPDHVSAQTNAEGRAEIIIGNEGLNVIAAQTVLPVSGNPDISERGLFTSLTFVGAEHKH
jgi:hypothetical protein